MNDRNVVDINVADMLWIVPVWSSDLRIETPYKCCGFWDFSAQQLCGKFEIYLKYKYIWTVIIVTSTLQY